MGKVPYRENDRPVGAAVPEGMEGTMSSPVSLFKTSSVVVDPKSGKAPRRGPYPEVRKEPPSRPARRLSLLPAFLTCPYPCPQVPMEAGFTSPTEVILLSCMRTRQVAISVGRPCRAAVLANLVQVKMENGVHGRW